jgi:hypothetical protein
MALTLVEVAKELPPGEEFRAAHIIAYASSNMILEALPLENIKGGAVRYNVEQTLPGIAFRGVNESWTESTGIINPVVESLVIAGGEAKVDNHILRTRGESHLANQVAMKLKALAHAVGHKIIKGDSDADPREFDGLQKRIVGSKKISARGTAGSSSSATVISFEKLDELRDLVENPTHLIMPRAIRRYLTTGARDPAQSTHFSMDYDSSLGRRVERWDDLALLYADRNKDQYATLAFDEADAGGAGSTFASVYCVSFADGGVTGIQSGAPIVENLGSFQASPVQGVRMEWDVGLAVWGPHSCARLAGIAAGAAVNKAPTS